jgi:uncharacterized membrane protein YeaQ/YmgE (transglycosylase-associated protein family)
MLVINLTTFGVLLSQSQQDSALSFAAWIGLGLVVGFIASKLLNKRRHGLRRDCLLGIVGAIVGGFLANLLGNPGVKGLDLYSLVVAAVGAAVFVLVYYALFRRRRFLNMR